MEGKRQGPQSSRALALGAGGPSHCMDNTDFYAWAIVSLFRE